MRKVCLPVILISLFLMSTVATAEEMPPLPVVGMMSEHFRNHDVRGEMYSDGSIRVRVSNADGSTLLESRYPVVKADGRFLEWRYDGENVVTQSTLIDGALNPTLEGMFFAAKDIVKMLGGGERPPHSALVVAPTGQHFRIAPMDSAGCDDLQAVSCTNKGVCCDIHDDCYARNGCHALSWLGLGSWECIKCNLDAVECFASPTPLGPAACCFNNTCGQPRTQVAEGSGGTPADERAVQNADPSLGALGGSGGVFAWRWTPYGSVGITTGSFCVMTVGGVPVYIAC